MDIQSKFTEYAFIDEASEAVSEGKAVAGALTYRQQMLALISRTYEKPFQWYFIVAKPYNRSYEKDTDWYQSKGINCVRRHLSKISECLIITRELLAEKTHINLIVCSSLPMLDRHESDLCNKYKLHVQQLCTQNDRYNVLDYITKEANKRPYIKYQDYYTIG